MKKQFPYSVFLLMGSLIGAAGAVILCGLCFTDLWSEGFSLVLCNGLIFGCLYFGGFFGMHLAISLHPGYRIERPGSWLRKGLMMGLCTILIAMAGQLLFMISREEVTRTVEEETVVEREVTTVDMAFLIDASSSMESLGYRQPSLNAAIQFVESLDETEQMQVIAFAGKVVGRTGLLVTDDDGKAELTAFIEEIDARGTTDFDAPLEEAVETLLKEGRDDSGKMIILLTDGDVTGDDETISASLSSTIADNNILLYTVRIAESENTDMGSGLLKLVETTGGMDQVLVPVDGEVDVAAMVEAFQNAAFDAILETIVEPVTETSMEFVLRDEEMITQGGSLWQLMVRMVTMLLCLLCFYRGYFGGALKRKLLINGAVVAGMSVCVTLGSRMGLDRNGVFQLLMLLLLVPVFGAACVRLEEAGSDPQPADRVPEMEEGDVIHV
ncbi:MAG: VWA domain-containing protein [Lachnospiraceae bacterium]|nr:VWA domain-containing protein [Lachnospiraceae bacterium]